MAINRNSDIHDAAAIGFSRAADAYERGRPEYSEKSVRYVSNRLYLFGSLLRVVDLAAGTGKFTKILDALSPRLVASLTDVEPVEAMRLKGESVAPHATFISGTAEDIPLASETCDVVTVA